MFHERLRTSNTDWAQSICVLCGVYGRMSCHLVRFVASIKCQRLIHVHFVTRNLRQNSSHTILLYFLLVLMERREVAPPDTITHVKANAVQSFGVKHMSFCLCWISIGQFQPSIGTEPPFIGAAWVWVSCGDVHLLWHRFMQSDADAGVETQTERNMVFVPLTLEVNRFDLQYCDCKITIHLPIWHNTATIYHSICS